MATLRDRPYTQFNFLVDLGDGNTDGPSAGFQEVASAAESNSHSATTQAAAPPTSASPSYCGVVHIREVTGAPAGADCHGPRFTGGAAAGRRSGESRHLPLC